MIVISLLALISSGVLGGSPEQSAPPPADSVAWRLEHVAGIAGSDATAFFESLKKGVAARDARTVCALVAYPLRQPEGAVSSTQACQSRYDQISPAPVVKALADQEFDKLFVNARGAMVGSGQIWFASICQGQRCAVKITAVNR